MFMHDDVIYVNDEVLAQLLGASGGSRVGVDGVE